MSAGPPEGWGVRPAYAWLVFVLTIGLLLADYMSRQVLVSVFPALRAEWRLDNAQLGGLVSIVAVMVGALTLPLSVVADRIGRVRAIVGMATLWSLATVGCGLAANYGQMFAARMFIGIGEAAYGSVGAAVLLAIFPASLRATITGAFMAGGALGSVAGLAIGGVVADALHWRASFFAIAAAGLALTLLYALVVSDKRLPAPVRAGQTAPGAGGLLRLAAALLDRPEKVLVYLASGAQIFLTAACLAWLPSLLNRNYALSGAASAEAGAAFLVVMAVGSTVCAFAVDRLSRGRASRRALAAAAIGVIVCSLAAVAFGLPAGKLQLWSIGALMFFVAGANGPAAALVADLTPPRTHASSMAVLTLANNFVGIALGPYTVGLLADRIGLAPSLQSAAIAPAIGALAFAAAAAMVGARAAAANAEPATGTPGAPS